MKVPMWMAQINKRTFNKLEMRRGKRPVIIHVGRASGRTFHTPLDAHRIDGGFIFFVMYGTQSDWVQNVLTAGEARLEVGDEEFGLVNPRIVSEEAAWEQLPETTKAVPGLFTPDYLQMDIRE